LIFGIQRHCREKYVAVTALRVTNPVPLFGRAPVRVVRVQRARTYGAEVVRVVVVADAVGAALVAAIDGWVDSGTGPVVAVVVLGAPVLVVALVLMDSWTDLMSEYMMVLVARELVEECIVLARVAVHILAHVLVHVLVHVVVHVVVHVLAHVWALRALD
jgi:hypothetical protein